jgi:hypothetical protein
MDQFFFQWGGFISFIIILMIPISLVLTLMGIYNVMKLPTKDSILRMTWVIILIFIPFFGFIYYLTIGIKQIKES